MTKHATDAIYLAYQYGTSEKLRIRQEAHEKYSEQPNDFFPWALGFLALTPGLLVADVGCGPGAYHALVAAAGCRVVGIDASFGMVTDVRRQARRQELPVYAIQAAAEQLPLASERCDRVMANHMLYHVGDQRAALRELWRVLAPGGLVLLATNAADANDVLHAAHQAAADELGYHTVRPVSDNFHLGHISLVQEVFPNATVHVRPDAFRFPSLEAALRYYASGMIDAIEHAPGDGSHRPLLLERVAARLHPQFTASGYLRVPKDAGCFVARKE